MNLKNFILKQLPLFYSPVLEFINNSKIFFGKISFIVIPGLTITVLCLPGFSYGQIVPCNAVINTPCGFINAHSSPCSVNGQVFCYSDSVGINAWCEGCDSIKICWGDSLSAMDITGDSSGCIFHNYNINPGQCIPPDGHLSYPIHIYYMQNCAGNYSIVNQNIVPVIFQLPASAVFSSDTDTVCINNPVQFILDCPYYGTNTTYSWDFGCAGCTGTGIDPTFTYSTTGTFNVCNTAITTLGGSADTCGISFDCRNIVVIDSCSLMSGDEISNSETFIFYPNPFSETITIIINTRQITKFNFALYNIYGQEMITNRNVNSPYIFRKETLSPGIYSYRINTSNGKFYTGKLIVE